MEPIVRDVLALDDAHRRAFEDVIGRALQANQRLVINVLELDAAAKEEAPTGCFQQSLGDWTSVFAGLSNDRVDEIDRIAKTRADLSRFAQ